MSIYLEKTLRILDTFYAEILDKDAPIYVQIPEHARSILLVTVHRTVCQHFRRILVP